MPEKSAPYIVRDLLRWQADSLRRVDRGNEAEAVMRRAVDLLDGTRAQLVETVDWLMEREAWSLIEEMAGDFPERFKENAVLLYRMAELQMRRGEEELAEETADRAVKTNQDDHQEHIEAAYSLQERGLFKWSEREYRHVMKLAPAGSLHELRSGFLLSEMLHDLERELPAAQILQTVVDNMDKDKNIVHTAARMRRDRGSVGSRMHYFYSERYRSEGNLKKQREHLQEAVKSDPTDADVLIAMYRVDGAGEQWKDTTRQHIKEAVQGFRDQMRECEQEVASAPSEELRAFYRRELASANNQLAWLVGNTEGDYDEALRCSQRSLELRPNTAGYLDTLGRCYYAKGDYANAVKHQSRAVELEPHSGQIRRQLELFREALEASAKPEQ
jgi:tetratricopeptide (TPR) repeat protein